MNPPAFHLAQLNLARFRTAADDPANAGYLAALAAVDASAERAPGFVWRLRGAGALASGADAFGDAHVAANLSVWTDRDALVAFVYRDPAHRAIMARRRDWFDKMEAHLVLWWVPAGHRPGFADARFRLDLLRRDGPTADAFTVARGFPAPG
ncbi:DUF3291 domain-containing protein [Lichenibacterium minor]|uniref:DUF3291 domain-containing protein n=1 Tax=Lichenibacterium minor TaxID=2316528 RepID=A0A4Q2UB23_9HYPH|nr:DUF3291 domain-containing protein [Lichenibacterium minor]RYC32421.1 DUF3291 domain-containing protein [Lichenibacterium minor]